MPPATATDADFAALLAQHRARLLGFLQRLCGADAEDVLQDTLAKVWRLRHTFDAQQDGGAWLQQAAFRTFCDRRAARGRQHPVDATAGHEPPAPARPCPIELADEVQAHLQRLEPLARALLLGFHAQGLSLRELAARHGLPLNTVKSHLHRARAQLQARHAQDGDDR